MLKKIIFINNQQDLIQHLKKKQKSVLIIEYVLVNNLGIVLLKKTIDYHNNDYHIIVLNVQESLSYLIFAIENHFKFIMSTLPKEKTKNFTHSATAYNCKIFNFTEY